MKDFIEQLNDIIAPRSRAYSEPEILQATLTGENIKDKEAVITVVVRVKRVAWGRLR